MRANSILCCVLVVLSGCGSWTSAFGFQGELDLPETGQKRLLNDLQVIVAPTPALGDDLTIGLVLRYGAAFDPANKAGVAHLLSRMFLRATIDKTAEGIQAELDYLNADIEVGLDWDGFRFLLRGRSDKFERSLWVLYQVVAEAQFLDEDFAEVKAERLEELARIEDPRQGIRAQFEKELYRGTTYGREMRGSADSVDAIQPGDLRFFYRRFFSPDEAALVVVGAVPAEEVLQKAARIWGVWVRKEQIPYTFLPPSDPDGRRVFLEDDPSSPAAQFIMGNLWTRRDELEYYPALLASQILQERLTGALPTSLLTVNAVGRRLPGQFYIQGQAAAEQASQEIQRIRDVVESFQSSGVSSEELGAAKRSRIEDFKRDLSSAVGICGQIMDAELYKLGTNYLVRYPEVIGRTDVDSVQRAARAHFFPGGFILLVRGPASILSEGLESLGPIQQINSPH